MAAYGVLKEGEGGCRESSNQSEVVPYSRVQVVINPAAGGQEPVLNILNSVFREHGVKWDASVTHQPGDATRLAREAVARGVDLVAGYGGDGTQMELANALIGSTVPLGILPGGTGNAMAFELGIPRDLAAATRLLCQSDRLVPVDVARVGGQHFMLRAYTGPSAELVASREEKQQLGLLAYPLATMRVLKSLTPTRYLLRVDHQEIEETGLACFVFNAGAAGGLPASLPNVSATDGQLDVFVFNTETTSPPQLAGHLLGLENANVRTYQGRTIQVISDPVQPLWLDGEPCGETPVTIELLAGALKVAVGLP